MKRQIRMRKLVLQKETLRVVCPSELGKVKGGLSMIDTCDPVTTMCMTPPDPTTMMTQTCPPRTT